MIDKPMVAVFVTACVLHRSACVAAQQLITTDGSPGLLSKYVSIASKQAAIIVKVAAELGFTPTARIRLSLPPSGDDDQPNPFDRWRR
jgi:hypothetical protein